MAQMNRLFFERIKNIMGKGENASNCVFIDFTLQKLQMRFEDTTKPSRKFNPFPNKPLFLTICSISL